MTSLRPAHAGPFPVTSRTAWLLAASAVTALGISGAGCAKRLNNDLAIGAGSEKWVPPTFRDNSSTGPGSTGAVGRGADRPENGDAAAGLARPAEPSVLGLDRDNWDSRHIRVVNAMPAHQPVYHRDVFDNTGQTRNATVGRRQGSMFVDTPTALPEGQRHRRAGDPPRGSTGTASDWSLSSGGSGGGQFPTFPSSIQTGTADGPGESGTGNVDQVREAIAAPFIAGGDVVLALPRMLYKRPWFVTRSGMQGGGYERGPRERLGGATVSVQRMEGSTGYPMPEAVGTARFPMAVPNALIAAPASPPAQPAPAKQSPAQPAPLQPAPAQPAPSPAQPAAAAPAQPAPAQPAPAQPAPAPAAPQPEPAKPAATEPEGKPAKHIGVSDPLGPK